MKIHTPGTNFRLPIRDCLNGSQSICFSYILIWNLMFNFAFRQNVPAEKIP